MFNPANDDNEKEEGQLLSAFAARHIKRKQRHVHDDQLRTAEASNSTSAEVGTRLKAHITREPNQRML